LLASLFYPLKKGNDNMKTVKPDEWYLTDKDTILHITATEAPDIPSSFPFVVKGTDEAKVTADVLRRCYESDSTYTRKALVNPFGQLIDISIKQTGSSRTASFRKAYGDGGELLSFSLTPRDEVRKESLYRLFADSLERMLLEPSRGQSIGRIKAYDVIARTDSFRLNDIVPSMKVWTMGECLCFYVPPEFLSEETHFLTETGKIRFGTGHVEDLLYRFASWAEDKTSLGYEEYTMDGLTLRGQNGFFGPDITRSGMGFQSGLTPVKCLGRHKTISECITSLKAGKSKNNRSQCPDR
jgi:hypothetical protein